MWPFGRATVVAAHGGVVFRLRIGASAGHVWDVVPLSMTASLCLKQSKQSTGVVELK